MAVAPLPPHVASGELITSQWGNQVVDRLGQTPQLLIASGVVTVITDAYGNAVLTPAHTGVPASGRIQSAVAMSAQRDFPMFLVLNKIDMPLGGASCAFKVWYYPGTGAANNATIEVVFIITYVTW